MVNESPNLLIGLLGILKSGNCFVPINPLYPKDRINYLINDCNIKILLTDSPNYERAMQVTRHNPRLLQVLCIDHITVEPDKKILPAPGGIKEENKPLSTGEGISPDQRCYIIYTSGSTGKPKGVPITHRNLTPLLLWFGDYFNLGKDTKILQTLSYTFDFGIFEIFSTLLFGGTIYFKDFDQMSDLSEYPDFINEYEINTIHTTPSFFNSIIWLEKKMPTLKRLHFGGEKLTIKMIREVSRLLEGEYKIHNGYGPTETTINSTIFSITPREQPYIQQLDSIPIGRPSAENIIYILDNLKHLLPIGVSGEICIAGHGVATGYLNQPELTFEMFINNPYPPGGIMYCTGDLGRWLPDGNVQYLGRMDDQVKVRGFRIEPGEIENCMLTHEKIRDAAVMVKEDDRGDKYLCAYFVPGNFFAVNLSSLELKEYLSARLPDHMIPSFFVSLEMMPLSSSGKIDRQALPEPTPIDETAAVPPQNPLQERMQKIWQELLGFESIGIHDNFFSIGGHSLKATILVSKLHKAFNVKIPLAELFKTPTIKGLSAYIAGSVTRRFASIPSQELKEYYALSSAQKRFYILQQMESGTTAYNIPQVVSLEGDLEKEKVEDTFKKLLDRHESLRTFFHIVNDKPVQRIHENVEFEIEYDPSLVNCQGRGEVPSPIQFEQIIRNFIRTFDLSKAPLMRVGLIPLHTSPPVRPSPATPATHQKEILGGRYILMLDMHHIISDAVSQQIFVKELMSLYEGKELSPLKLHYKDYAQWKNSEIEREAVKKQEEYWLNEFPGEIPVLDLPLDYKRPAVQSFEGNTSGFDIDREEIKLLKALASGEGLTLHMIMVGIYTIFLSKISGQEEILMGTPTAGRRHVELEQIIGIFVNTLVLKNYPQGRKTCKEFLKEVKAGTLQALENQDYQFEDLVDRLSITRDASRNPLFDTMFALNNADIPGIEIPGLKLTPYVKESTISKFDLTLSVAEAADGLIFEWEYCTKLFKKETIEKLITYFKKVLYSVIKKPEQLISAIEIITTAEKQQLLLEFNDVNGHYPTDKTLHRLFEAQEEKNPDHVALVRQNSKQEGFDQVSLSYRELNEKSNRLAYLLQERGVQPDSIVAIMVERSIEMMVGILGILKSGGAYLPIDPDYPRERIDYMLADSAVKILLTADEINRGPKPPYLHLSPAPATTVSSSTLTSTSTCQVSPANLAYVIYTSGSTGRPKGVPITHANVCPLLCWGHHHLGLNPGERVIQNLSYFFDWSVWEIFLTLTSGAALFIVDRELLLNPEACIGFMHIHQISVLHITPTHFQSFIHGAQKLETLKFLCLGAEQLTLDLVKHCLRLVNKDCRVFNMYGPTEAAIIASVLDIDLFSDEKYENLSNIPIGKPIANTYLLILDMNLNMCPVHVKGELFIAGDGLAVGYLNDIERTSTSFIKNIFTAEGVKGEWLYKTGDLARWLPNGTIEFLGRIDHQVKIRGHRIELGEIENQILAYREITEAVVVNQWENDHQYLCAYVVSKSKLEVSGLREFLLKKLPDYMVPPHFVRLDNIPLTPNGKLARKALPLPQVKADKRYLAPRDRWERKLVEIWAEVLDLEKDVIGIEDNFFQLGGHSLKATILIAKIHKEFQVILPLAEVFKKPNIRGLSGYITGLSRNKYNVIEPVEKKEYYPLSSAQKRLYILNQLEPGGTNYNIPYVIPLEEEIDKEKLETTFKKLIARHESLRTSFQMTGEEPVQLIHGHVEFEIEYDETGNRQEAIGNKDEPMPETLIKNFIRPFDLSRAPLLRVGLIPLHSPPGGHASQEGREQNYILMVDMHHIITDGTSQGILTREFAALYPGEELPPLRVQYKDFSVWQNQLFHWERIKRQESYWLKKFQSEIPVLDLPTDYARPAIQRFQGSMIHFQIGKEKTDSLKQSALAQGASLYMVLLSLTYIWLSKLSSQEDIVIGTPVAGRRHAELEKIIGMFVNTLPLRNHPSPDKPFKEFIQEVKKDTLEALENQEYPFEELVDMVTVNRDTGRNPLFDVMLVYQNFALVDHSNRPLEKGPGEIVQVTNQQQPASGYENNTAKFDMTINVSEDGEGLALSLQYSTALFKKKTGQRFTRYFKKIVSVILNQPDIKLGQIEIISAEEKKQILETFNDTQVEYPTDTTIHQLFEDQAQRTPDNIAVIQPLPVKPGTYMTHMTYISYRELNERSNQLAVILKEKGVASDTVAAIMVDSSIEMIAGILSILKAGGAYLPIDLEYPADRIKYMLADSSAAILLTTPNISRKITFEKEIVQLTDEINRVPTPHLHLTPAPVTTLAYVIYTSGTTGKPKGVVLGHESLVNYVHWFTSAARISGRDKTLLTSSFAFDLGYTSLYASLLKGGELHIVSREIYLLGERFLNYISQEGISFIKVTPSLFSIIVNSPNFSEKAGENLRLAVIGGEAINVTDIEKAHRLCPRLRVMNHYGPTEATIGCVAQFVDFHNFEEYKQHPVIGTPSYNTAVYILNQELRVLPVGLAGELCISGTCLARGYLNRPELTNAKFQLPNKKAPFGQSMQSCNHATMQYHSPSPQSPITPIPQFPIYLTGDLARWLSNGTIEFLGRIDSQVKVRGYRIELAEIENLLLKHPGVKEAVVLAREKRPGDKYLCAYIVTTGVDLEVLRLKEYLVDILPAYMIPAYFVEIEKIPLTANGKIDRKTLPLPGIKPTEYYSAPGNKTEEKLTELWSEVLQVEKEIIDIDLNFFDIGGHSLNAVILLSKIHKEFDVKVPLVEIFKAPFIRKLANYINAAKRNKYESIAPVEKKEYYALSSAQQRFFILQQMDPGGIAYNMPRVMLLEGKLNKQRFLEAFQKLIHRHESLRTSFRMKQDTPLQKVHDEVEFDIEYYDHRVTGAGDRCRGEEINCQGRGEVSSPIEIETIIRGFIRPFDLSRGPLLRVGLIKPPHTPSALRSHPSQEGIENKYLLMVDVHHIVSDGISTRQLSKDFLTIYSHEEFQTLKLQYKDYCQWQHYCLTSGKLKEQENYWLNCFSGELPVLRMPTDYPRPSIQQFAGNTISFHFNRQLSQSLNQLMRKTGTTLYMMVLAIYSILLSKYSGQEDIIIGTPTAGRNHAALENVIGLLMETFAIRNYPTEDKVFAEFLAEVKTHALDAFENQAYPFGELLKHVWDENEHSRNPLFDAMLVVQNLDTETDTQEPGIGTLKLVPYEDDSHRISKVDLSLVVFEREEKIFFILEYCTALFKRETMERLISSFKEIVVTVLRNKTIKLGDIRLSHDLLTAVSSGEYEGAESEFDF
jgi:tyrocidine synthetase-3